MEMACEIQAAEEAFGCGYLMERSAKTKPEPDPAGRKS
jgi:hypothetical protein